MLRGAEASVSAKMKMNPITSSVLGGFSLLLTFYLSGCAASLDHRPLTGLPAVAEGKIYNDDWGKSHEQSVSDRFNSILTRKFPIGSSEDALVQTLVQEGFQYARPAQPGCIPEDKAWKMPIGQVFVPCPHWDPKHHLRYSWAPHELPPTFWAFCSQTIGVTWDAKDGKLTQITGYFGGDCV
jgi:hypothetical protein